MKIIRSPNGQAIANHFFKHTALHKQGHEDMDSIVDVLRAPWGHHQQQKRNSFT